MDGTFQLRLLGPVQVERDGESVGGFESRKALALLGYLALQDKPVPRQYLVELLWSGKSEARGRANLSWVLSRISSLLPGCLKTDRHTVQFEREAPCWLDIVAFEELETQGDAASLAAAVELYRGEFLEGLYLDNCPEFEIWLVGEREQWRQRLAQVLEALVTHHGRHGEHHQGLGFAQRLLALEPWREETHRHVMRLLAYGDQRGAALAQYETCRRVLSEELGVEPAAETTQLYEQIRDGELEIPVVPQAVTRKHNLPAQLTPFIGREAESTEIAERLQDPACRLLTLVGAGGCGKTRLALEVAADQVDNYAHGVYFVSLAPLQSVDGIVPAVAEAVGFRFYEGGQPRQQLLDYLCEKQMLIILDNFEHLLPPSIPRACGGDEGEEGLVTEILRTAPEVKILATSRVRLNVGGEYRFRVGGMRFPETLPEAAIDASQYSAIELFLQGARRAQPSFELTNENLSGVVQVCRLVAGMPLGIRLATAWVETLTPAEIGVEIGRSLDFLRTDRRDIPQRQRSVRAAFDHSWNLLTADEQAVMQALSVFRGGFTREAAQEVTGASLRVLMTLVSKSFLDRTLAASTDPSASLRTEGRYELHELLRQYAAEKLGESPAASETAHDRHCAHYATALQRWALDLKSPRQQAALAEMEAEIENARAAWNWAVEQEQVERLDQALEGLCLFYDWRGRWQEGETACRVAADRLAAGEGARVRARALAWQGRFSWKSGGTGPAGELLRQSLALLEGPELSKQDTRSERAFVLFEMGIMVRESTAAEEARLLCEQSLALYRALGDRWSTAYVLDELGRLSWQSSAYGEAGRLFEDSLAIRRSLNDQRGIASSILSLGLTAAAQGRLEESERLLREGVALSQEMGDRLNLAGGFLDLAATSIYYRGKFTEAYPLLEKSEAIYSDAGWRDKLALCNYVRSWGRMHQGQYEQARDRARVALTIAREVDHRWWVSVALCALGGTALAEGAHAEARDLLEESIASSQEIGLREDRSRALPMLGYAARMLGQPSRARLHLSKALRAGAETGGFLLLVLPLPAVALLLADRGEKERAVELYALASRYPMVANSQWYEDVAGQHIAAVAVTLPAEVVEAARERGRARDLEATVAELLAELGK